MDNTDYAIRVTVRNGRIIKRMRARGITSVAELARMAGVRYHRLTDIVGLKLEPIDKNGEWRECIRDIAGVLQCDPEDLFTEKQATMRLARNSDERFVSEEYAERLTGGDMEEATWAKIEANRLLDQICDPRTREIIEQRMVGRTYDEIGVDFRLSVERIRQIEHKAHRALRSSSIRAAKDNMRRMMLNG